jgi:hypothetical protein
MIGILGFIAVFIVAYFAYKTANGTGRNGVLWALAALGVGFGFQIVLPIVIGIVMAFAYMAMGTPVDRIPEQITGPATIIGFVMLFLSFVGLWLILRHVSKFPEDPPAANAPPPPPTFEGS